MKGHTHMASGIVLALVIILFGTLNKQLFIGIAFFLLGVVFPDVDEINSFLGRKVKFFAWVFNHRGFFHSFFGLVLFYALFWGLFGPYYSTFFALGYLFHLFQDAFTKAGLKPFMYSYRISGSLRVGSFMENIHFLFLLFLIFGILIKIFFF